MLNKNEDVLPEGIRGWSWGAFLLNVIWAVFNKTWIGLLCFVPFVGIFMPFVLGFKGREWAWKNDTWDSVEHFNRVQRNWSKWGIIITLSLIPIGILFGMSSVYLFESVSQHTTTATNEAIAPNMNSLEQPATPILASPTVVASINNVSGTWSTDIVGDVTIEQMGNKVIGNYEYDDDDGVTQIGKFDGVIETNLLKGDWHESPKKGKGDKSHGDFELTISSDATTLKGWYRNEGEKDKEGWILVHK